jgi:geranylgeranyl pyrophosphate synthase
VGQDLLEGQVTLPFIYLQESFNSDDHEHFLAMTRSKDFDFTWIQSQLQVFQVEARVKKDLKKYEETAQNLLAQHPPSEYKAALLNVLNFVSNRS